jgi:DNA-directed RNA polymerase subunit omega
MDALSLLPQHHQNQFDSRFRIVLIAAQRAKQLVQGMPGTSSSKFAKETSQALEEVLQGKVPYLIGSEAKQAMRDAKRIVDRPIDPSLYAQQDENAAEIKKELSVYIDDTEQHQVTEVEPEE